MLRKRTVTRYSIIQIGRACFCDTTWGPRDLTPFLRGGTPSRASAGDGDQRLAEEDERGHHLIEGLAGENSGADYELASCGAQDSR